VPLRQLHAIEDAVHREARRYRADLLEYIWNWAWNEYVKAGSLKALLSGTRSGRYTRRVSEELQDQMDTALRTILERAPSPAVDELAQMLIQRAREYGEPK
jgi:hypothetical protein